MLSPYTPEVAPRQASDADSDARLSLLRDSDRSKNIFDVERFSGKSVHTIQQDFYEVIFLATLESILSKPAQAELTVQGATRECCSVPQVNRALSYVTVLDHVVHLLGDARRSPAVTLAARVVA